MQSIRVTPLADMPLGTMMSHIGLASYNSVVNNQVGWGISFHTRDTETWRGIPAYTSANTSKNGVANYNDGTYVLMPIRIHMHKGRHGIHRSHRGQRRCPLSPAT